MKNKTSFLIIILAVFIILGCESDDTDPCFNVDPLFQNFVIELVDADGNNLIENNTYIRSEIKVFLNENVIGGVPEPAVPVNFISIELLAVADNQVLEVVLGNNDTDELILSIESGEPGGCGLIPLTVTNATYNGTERTIIPKDEIDNIPKIVVVK